MRKVGRCSGGICRTSLLYKIVCLETVLFSGLFAGYAIARGDPGGKRPDGRWIAGGAAGAILGLYALFAGVFGELWWPIF